MRRCSASTKRLKKMIRRRRLETLFVLAGLAMSPLQPGAAQDATFPCKVLLCSQANWTTIRYCVPIMQQAIWMQLLPVAVGICQQAVQQAQQNQSIPQSPLAANAPSGLTNTISCPSGAFAVSQTNGGYTINTSGSMCGAPTSPAVQAVVASQCLAYTDGTCAFLFKPADLTITNPLSPAQSGGVTGQ
jgi:hypothetical protein